jgi:hypothetical protein
MSKLEKIKITQGKVLQCRGRRLLWGRSNADAAQASDCKREEGHLFEKVNPQACRLGATVNRPPGDLPVEAPRRHILCALARAIEGIRLLKSGE